MFLISNPFLVVFFGVAGGFIIGYLIRQFLAKRQIDSVEVKAEKLIANAKNEAQELLLNSKGKALKILDDAKKDEKIRHEQLMRIERLLTKREKELETTQNSLTKEKEGLKEKAKEVVTLKESLEKNKAKQLKTLEKISGLGKEKAKELLYKKVENEHRDELYEKLLKLEKNSQEAVDKKARELITLAIQRYASSQVSDVTTTVVNLPNDELKGKIIGREGRNIKTIERLTGVDIIVDDTPEAIVLSGFDAVRRQVAKLAIEKLIADGRIHPAKIEEMVGKAQEEIDQKIREAGDAAIYDTGVGPLDPRLTFLLGRLAFRTSFGQNVLMHSVEMAHIASMLAEELGADVGIAKKGALLHDIGKAVDHEVQGTHVQIGRKILQKFGIDERVMFAMQSHHEEFPYATLEARIVQAADAISAARPGARRETVEFYLKRLEDLERISTSFEGVEKAYAVQAGREIRIFVQPTQIDDLGALKLAKDVAKRIEEEMKYPGEIKVNVIRETRAIEYAR